MTAQDSPTKRLVSMIVVGVFSCLPIALSAQEGTDQMQAMMAYAQAMQTCAANIDQGKMQSRGAQMQEEMTQLCAAGKRDEAQSRAIAYGQEMAADPGMKAMHECMKKAEALKPDMPATETSAPADYTQFDQNHHVCDNL